MCEGATALQHSAFNIYFPSIISAPDAAHNWHYHAMCTVHFKSVLSFRASALSALVLLFAVTAQSAPVKITLRTVRSCTGTCCLPQPPRNVTSVPLWRPTPGAPIRVRRPASEALQDPVYLAKYKRAYELLRSTNQYAGQVAGHCAYCSPNPIFVNVHGNWLFFPWHRWFLFWHERILSKLIGDPDFTLPFWDWDLQQKQIPFPYTNLSSPLYDPLRNSNPSNTESQIRSSTTAGAMQTNVFTAKTTDTFFSGPLGANLRGSVETRSHGAVHNAVGRQVSPYTDMGNLQRSSNDPLFWVHHCNVDRLWWIWKRLPPNDNGEPRSEPTSPDWLDSEFIFYDENQNLQRVRVGDAIETTDLGYTYKDVPLSWLPADITLAPPKTGSSRRRLLGAAGKQHRRQLLNSARRLAQIDDPTTQVLPGTNTTASLTSGQFTVGGTPVTVTVGMARRTRRRGFRWAVRDRRGRFSSTGSGNEEVLILKGFQLYSDTAVKVKVFINNTRAVEDESGDADESFVGTYIHFPNGSDQPGGRPPKENLQFSLSYYLGLKGKKDAPAITVTLIATNLRTGDPIDGEVASVDSAFVIYR